MRWILFFSLTLTACDKFKLDDPSALGGSGGGGTEKNLGPGAALKLNLADFPNVAGQIYGIWSMTETDRDTHGGTYQNRMYFAKNKIGRSTDCEIDGYDITASLAISATYIAPSTIVVAAAGRHDAVSEDGQLTCTSTIRAGRMTYKVSGNDLILTDMGGNSKHLTRLLFF